MSRFMPLVLVFAGLFAAPWWAGEVMAQEDDGQQLRALEVRVAKLEGEPKQDRGAWGGAAFLCGAFCALWAQNTGRNAWLWFFVGLFFNVVTVLVLLYKNSKDKQRRGMG
jgi:hypothetical protein